MEQEPIYIHVRDDDYFRIMQIIVPDGDLSNKEMHYLGNTEMFHNWFNHVRSFHKLSEPEQQRHLLLTQYLVLAAGEEEHRVIHKRITDSNTRNIRFQIEKPRRYLMASMERAIRQKAFTEATSSKHKPPPELLDKKVKETIKMAFPTPKSIDEVILQAIKKSKKDLKFPDPDPVEFSYKITKEVLAAATSEACKEYLQQQTTRVAIYPYELEQMEQHLKNNFSTNNEAQRVIAEIKKTKNREHIAALSITSEKDQTFVGLVNIHRQHIRMEAWKFLALIDRSDESLRLTEFLKPKLGEPPPLFVFNNNKEGVVIGKFTKQRATIDVVCLNEGKEPHKDKATFILDGTYTLCVYTILKRLQKDRERYKELLEEAQTLFKTKDPFDSLYQPQTS